MDEITSIAPAEDNELFIKFGKPFEFEGKTYTEIDLSGLEDLTGIDLLKADRILRAQGITAPLSEMTPEAACYFAGIAAGLPMEFFKTLPIKEMVKVRTTVMGFLYAGEE